ncbi:MAG TPA: penicillin-binding protein 2 [Candidatus Paceibacterota bacterium]|nr:penicillin-binding protein 2 [Candidatus Paceibacterota bacterium]
MKLSSFQIRIRFVIFSIFVVALILITRLFFVQIIHRNLYIDRADKQYITPSSNIFNRGGIFFSKKDGSLVTAGTVVSGFKLAIVPKDIVDVEDAYTKLDPYMEMDKEVFLAKASKKNDPYEEIAKGLSKEQITEIENLKIKGVSIYKDKWRFYPGNNLASHTIGFLAYKGDTLSGQYGLERFYNATLSKPEDEAYVNFFAEVFSNIRDTISNTNKGDVITTIEPVVQYNLEKELTETLEKWHADQIGGIVMNPETGEIYAIAGMPDFDLNNFKSVTDVGVYRNPIVENVLEFGSVIKPLVMAAAIDKGVVTPETTYFDAGHVIVDKKTINNFDKKGRGTATMQDVLDQSLNTGMVFIETKLGHDSFRTYMKSYGIGEKTGIDLPNETSGLIKNLESPRNLEYANASFGQGIALTPIEAVRAFAILANGGKLVTPHLVKEVKYENGFSKKMEYPFIKENLLKKESTDTVTKMLVHVFESYDKGVHKMDNYSIATKTGTAQVAREDGKGYYTDRNTHSFFGYFPAYEPKFLVFLFLKNPKEVKYASQTLIPPFEDITKFILNYYNVPPDR